MALIFGYISRYAVLPRCGNYPGFVEGSWTFSTEQEFQEYSNAFWDSVTISFSKRVDVRRDFYAFLFWGRNSLTNRRSCFPLNWARYQIWTKATGGISAMALIFGYIYRYAALRVLVQFPWCRRRLLKFPRGKKLRGYYNAFRGSVTISFSECVDVRRDLYAFLFWASNYLANRRSWFLLNWARYQIRTKATGEISVTALIFGYISRYAALFTMPGCNFFAFAESSWTYLTEKEPREYSNAFSNSVTIFFL